MDSEEFICEEEMEDGEFEDEETVDRPDSPSPSTSSRRGSRKNPKDKTVRYHLCSRPFKSLEGYKRHLLLHVAEDLYKSAPGLETALEKCRPEALEILGGMISPLVSTPSPCQTACQFAASLQSLAERGSFSFIDKIIEDLWNCIPPASLIDPSGLNSKYVQSVSHLLADTVPRKSITEELQELLSDLDCAKDLEAINWFICKLTFELSEVIEVIYLKALNSPRETLLPTTNLEVEEKSIKFKRTVHFMGGSVVKSAFRLARRYRGNCLWDNISECLRKRFLCGELASGVVEDISKWTESRSRGGLLFVSECVWSFLMALSGLLEQSEKCDGSLNHSEILIAVENDDILMFLWCEVVGDNLSEDENVILLRNICRLFVNAWGEGIANRMKNAIVGRSRDKVPLRSSLLTK